MRTCVLDTEFGGTLSGNVSEKSTYVFLTKLYKELPGKYDEDTLKKKNSNPVPFDYHSERLTAERKGIKERCPHWDSNPVHSAYHSRLITFRLHHRIYIVS